MESIAAWFKRSRLSTLFNVEREEVPAVAAGVGMFYLLFAGYFMLRPVRETMGIAGGIDNLQWLFTATFVATLIALPLFGWIASKVPRRHVLAWTYAFFTLNLIAFAVGFVIDPDNIWMARTFYVWLSVFNLLAISLAWSVLADVLAASEAKRLFAMIAGGASLGGLTGPILGTTLVAPIGHAGLLLLAAVLLALSALAAAWLHRWRDRSPQTESTLFASDQHAPRGRPLGGHPFAGASAVVKSGYLAAIALFVILLAVVSTFLYFEQAKLVAETFPDKVRQTQVFGLIDTVVQTLTIVIQVFLTGRIAERFGIGVLLVSVPLAMAAGFLWLAVAPVFAVLALIMIARRVGEYALVRPGREMLFAVAAPEEKYKAKNFIDTVVYRGGDAIGGWVKRGLDVFAESPALAMMIGAGIALGWAATGGYLGRRERQKEAAVA
ncbi:MFS transporter [Hyphomicrobium sp. LHD-15]|uniref:NTP/NDP exchange transporter n=1 Tax=Hyphomicrobium sp. LHD-15 TaxID=3072142 RepID=UPI00280C4036|nr:MFS transporter [Hyphomicrobium sp. LHD-15]MDQ8699289.1 MFS transporter [Hyphomicrobium sp. LHD-15]